MSGLGQITRLAADATQAAPKLAQLKQATENFEAMMVKSMVSAMRKMSPEVHFGESLGGNVYQDLLDDVLSKALSQRGGLGFGKALYDRMAPELLQRLRQDNNQP